MDVKVDVLRISPAAGEHCERKTTAQHEGDACVSHGVDRLRVDIPLVGSDRFSPFKLKGRRTSFLYWLIRFLRAHGRMAVCLYLADRPICSPGSRIAFQCHYK